MQIQKIPLDDISAVTCSYARPNNVRRCVKRLRELKLTEVIVWNNEAKPVSEATRNILCPKNIGSIGRYYAAMDVSRPYVLIIDDDHLLTSDGLNALRYWGRKYPVVVQSGYIFESPFQDYRQRTTIHSELIEQPTIVDMLLPSRGMIIPTDLYRQIPHHWAWGSQMVLRPGFITTDLCVSCAVWDLTKERPIVVPVKHLGAEKMEEEARDKALCYQKGSNQEKSKMLQWLVENGWEMMKSNT